MDYDSNSQLLWSAPTAEGTKQQTASSKHTHIEIDSSSSPLLLKIVCTDSPPADDDGFSAGCTDLAATTAQQQVQQQFGKQYNERIQQYAQCHSSAPRCKLIDDSSATRVQRSALHSKQEVLLTSSGKFWAAPACRSIHHCQAHSSSASGARVVMLRAEWSQVALAACSV